MCLPLDDDADAEKAHAAERAAFRKAIWFFGSFVVLIFGLMAYGFICDETPSDFHDLRVLRRNPSEAENAYALLAKIALALPPEPTEQTDAEKHFARIAEGKVVWDQAVMAAGLALYDPGLPAELETALLAPFSEAAELKDLNARVPEIGPLGRLARILTQRARLAAHAGDHSTASDLNLLTLRLGDRLAASQGVIIQVLTASAVQGLALESIRTHADSESVSPDALRAYLARMGDHEIGVEDYHSAFKLEHQNFSRVVADMKMALAGHSLGSKSVASLSIAPGLYLPNRTSRWYAEIIRAIISDPLPPRPTGTPTEADLILQGHMNAPWPGRVQNFTGRMLLGITVPSFEKILASNYRNRANLRLTRLYVALRLYQMEHAGSLPETLEGLVPAYLSSIPLDPFDDFPLRYGRELTTIWSIDRERLTITSANGELPRQSPAYRLRFARPPEPLPTFEEYQTQP